MDCDMCLREIDQSDYAICCDDCGGIFCGETARSASTVAGTLKMASAPSVVVPRSSKLTLSRSASF